MTGAIDSAEFRRILGHYPTGVCAITAAHGVEPVAMVVGSFTSVSLDPPLVAFLPDRSSTTWPRIKASGSFCVNILSDRQEGVCRTLCAKRSDKFHDIPHRPSEGGAPIIDGVVAWIECDLFAVHEAGDHFIAIGRVLRMDAAPEGRPLVFHRGAYGGVSLPSLDVPRSAVA